jgi:hypothetical protein
MHGMSVNDVNYIVACDTLTYTLSNTSKFVEGASVPDWKCFFVGNYLSLFKDGNCDRIYDCIDHGNVHEWWYLCWDYHVVGEGDKMENMGWRMLDMAGSMVPRPIACILPWLG